MNYNSFFELPLRSFALSSVSLFVSPCTIARYAAATLQINLLEDKTKSHQSSFIEPTLKKTLASFCYFNESIKGHGLDFFRPERGADRA